MKSPASTYDVFTANLIGERRTFDIRSDAKIWNLLTDKVYSDKVKAAVRETFTNALDSHVEAGNPAPFKVTLPTELDPVFRVRDFGIGMDHETVFGLYSTLMNTSKDGSNEQTGFLGIGSKAPLAVSDSFNVTCYDGVEARAYVVSIGSDGIPGIDLVATRPSDEPQGVEVEVPVAPHQISEFASKATDVALGFHLANGLPEGVKFTPPQVVLSGGYLAKDPGTENYVAQRWNVLARTYLSGTAHVWVRQGPVIYPVTDRNVLPGDSPVLRYGKTDTILVVDVPIGTADVSPDRESLSFDTKTTASVAAALDSAFREVHDAARQQREDAANWREQVAVAVSQSGWYNAQGEENSPKSLYLAGGSDWAAPKFLSGSKFTKKVEEPRYAKVHPLAAKGRPTEDLTTAKPVRVPAFKHESLAGSVFYCLRPGTVRATTRIRRDIARRTEYSTTGKKFYVLDNPTPKQVERLLHLLGIEVYQIIEVADLYDEVPERAPRGSRQSGEAPVKRLTGVYNLNGTVEALEEFPEEDYLWVRSDSRAMSFRVPTYFEVNYARRVHVEQSTLHGHVSYLLRALSLPTTIVGFSPKAVEKHNPDPAKELHVALDAALAVQGPDLARMIAVDSLVSKLYVDSQYRLNHAAVFALLQALGEVEAGLTLEAVQAKVSSVVIKKCVSAPADDAQREVVERVTKAHPILFGRSVDWATLADYLGTTGVKVEVQS
jgi:hypothetical protein